MENQEPIIIPNTPPTSPNISNDTGINCCCNFRIVRLLRNLLSGRNGTLTSHLNYLYQYYIFNQQNPALAARVKEFSDKSATHMELLANAIIKFGERPKFSNGQGTPWSARYINYSNNISEQIRRNTNRETLAIREIDRVIALGLGTELNNILQQIMQDKKDFILSFENAT